MLVCAMQGVTLGRQGMTPPFSCGLRKTMMVQSLLPLQLPPPTCSSWQLSFLERQVKGDWQHVLTMLVPQQAPLMLLSQALEAGCSRLFGDAG